VYSGRQEEHIVADVAWAAAHYIDSRGDEAFATGPGLELLVQTARWWASRIERDADGSVHIRDVMGPDEYHEHVNDDAYTNVMARWNLRRDAVVALNGGLEQAERHRWLELADAIVDGYDPATQFGRSRRRAHRRGQRSDARGKRSDKRRSRSEKRPKRSDRVRS
jgi:trehalose/maltose hydrolase-like predicted phosphorylase